jgi:Ca-activated chloride channel homolog
MASDDFSSPNIQPDIIKVSSNLVVVPASVTDEAGRMIPNLTIGDFRIKEDGKLVEVAKMAAMGQSPLNLMLLFDLSGSISSSFEFEQAAAIRFLTKIWKTGDAVSIVAFKDKPNIYLHNGHNLSEALQSLRSLRPTQSSTAFYDSVLLSARILKQSTDMETLRVLIVFSDGADNRSDHARTDALKEIQRLNTIFYAINPSGASMQLNEIDADGQEDLMTLAAATGGSAFISDQSSDLDAIFYKIESELRAQYLLSYYSPDSHPPDTFHRIEVTLPDKPDLKIHARHGYRTNIK